MAPSSIFFGRVLGLLILSAGVELAVCQAFTIVPSNDTSCPDVVCYTLDQLAQNFSVISLNENVTLDLLPGDHTLRVPFMVQNLTRFEMRGNNATFSVNTSQFRFEQTSFVYFNRINFVVNSRALVVNEASEFAIEDCGFESNELMQINSTSGVLIVNSSFARSSSTMMRFMQSNVTIKGSVFANSNIVNSSRYFGLISIISSSLTVENCNFVDNSIFVDSFYLGLITTDSSGERFSIVNSTFRNNNAGLVAAQGSLFESVVISGCKFNNNNIDNPIPAILVRGQNVNVTDTTFTNNIVTYNLGYALEIFAERGSIRNCTFENNNVAGGTANLRLLEASSSSFVVEQNRFSNNVNGGFGGLSINADFCSVLTIRQNTFTSNSARLRGTLDLSIRRNCRTVLIEKNNFTDNRVRATEGGAVYYRESTSSSTSSDLITDIIIVDNVFVNNSAIICGSAIYGTRSFSGSQQTYRMRLNSSVFDSNGGLNTSLVCLKHGNITIINCNFSRGTDSRGGALEMTNTVTTIANSTFRFNYASIEGGAIYATGSRVNIGYSTLENNQAALRGGAISIDGGMLMVTNTRFNNNSASGGRGDNILACSSEVVLPDDALFSVRQDPDDSECFFYNKALSHGSFSSLAFFIAFTTLITSVL